MAGLTKSEIDLSWESPNTLDALVSVETDSDLVVKPMPNLYFTRDPFAVVGEGVSLNRMYSETRNRETIYGKYLFKYHPFYRNVSLVLPRNASFHIEGGDVLVLSDRVLAIGISQRTQAAAIDVMAQNVFWNSDAPFEHILAFNIPVSRAFMHLDTVFTQVDATSSPSTRPSCRRSRCSTSPAAPCPGRCASARSTTRSRTSWRTPWGSIGAAHPLRRGDPIAAAREQWSDGSNTLAVAPGMGSAVYQRNTLTNEALARAGLELLSSRRPSSRAAGAARAA